MARLTPSRFLVTRNDANRGISDEDRLNNAKKMEGGKRKRSADCVEGRIGLIVKGCDRVVGKGEGKHRVCSGRGSWSEGVRTSLGEWI